MTRVAIVHDRFVDHGSAAAVVEQLSALWPQAEVFVPVLHEATVPKGLQASVVHDTALRALYHRNGRHAHLLPLLAAAMSSMDLTGFDAVVTSHQAFAQRVRPPDGVPMVSYVHTPARWMWDERSREYEVGTRVGRWALSTFHGGCRKRGELR